ncbi:hypothetical protein ACI784_08820 [Geodermatophilus sp. SYSU D01186]
MHALTGVLETSSNEQRESIMNTYDPSDYITYVAMDRRHRPSVTAAPSETIENQLPEGYPNASPKTRLRSRAAMRARFDGQPLPGLAAGTGPGRHRVAPRATGTA